MRIHSRNTVPPLYYGHGEFALNRGRGEVRKKECAVSEKKGSEGSLGTRQQGERGKTYTPSIASLGGNLKERNRVNKIWGCTPGRNVNGGGGRAVLHPSGAGVLEKKA